MVFRYVGRLNGIENAIVVFTYYPKDSFCVKSALRVFLSTDLALSDGEIFEHYAHRWSIETFLSATEKILWLEQIYGAF